MFVQACGNMAGSKERKAMLVFCHRGCGLEGAALLCNLQNELVYQVDDFAGIG